MAERSREEPAPAQPQPQARAQPQSPAQPQADRPGRRQYRPRQCRICLDVAVLSHVRVDIFGSRRPIFTGDDSTLGPMISPCKCRGSQKYVHQECLDGWRLTNPRGRRNYFQCPTCQYEYKLSRIGLAKVLESKITQASLTLVIFVIGIFILGFLADPVLNMWIDPVGTITETTSSIIRDEDDKMLRFEDRTTWADHFLKGFFSLGLLGLFKSGMLFSPWYWYRHLGGRGRPGNGRTRVENISVIFVIIGVFSALVGIWKAVNRLSVTMLRHLRLMVLDIGVEDEDDFHYVYDDEESDSDESNSDEESGGEER